MAKKPEIQEQRNGEFFSNLSFQKQVTAQESTDSKVRVSARSSIDQFKVGSILQQNSSSFESSSQNSMQDSDMFFQKSLYNDMKGFDNSAPIQKEFEFKSNAYRA